MTSQVHSILQFESALNRDAQRKIRKIGAADLVIGIPSHRNGRTIGEVVDAVMAGVRAYFPDLRVVLMNADGGSSDNTVRHLEDADAPENVVKLLTTYEGITGKGTAIRSIFEAAGRLGARACAVVEARAIGIQPEWLPALITPVLQGDDVVMACYQRSALDAALTDNLVFPFLHSFWASELREPLASEFCVSGTMAMHLAECDVWETNVSRFGINVWLALHALSEHLRLAQVDLGYRGASGGEPAAPGDLRFIHAIGTLFRALNLYRRTWTQGITFGNVPFRGLRAPDRTIDSEQDLMPFDDAFRAGFEDYIEDWQGILTPETLSALKEIPGGGAEAPAVPVSLWVRLVYEFAAVFNKGEGDPDKVIEALLPIFYGRAATYARHVSSLTVRGRDDVIQDICTAFGEQRADFQILWDTYQEWEDDVTRFWTS